MLYCQPGESDLEGPLVHSVEGERDPKVMGKGGGRHQQVGFMADVGEAGACPYPFSLPR